ncbi:MAG: PAS domain S-box protein [Verrucomicrobiae bacterium]|nr:PAS domain S-box protein [Verrucomicrobiae bacterium]
MRRSSSSHQPTTTKTPKDAERQLNALLQKASELFAVLDANGTITCESPNQTGTLGFAPGELLGRNGLELLHPEDRAAAKLALQELLRNPGSTHRLEARIRTRDHQWRWLDIMLTNLLDDPSIAGLLLNARDITKQKLAEQAAAAAAQRWQNTFDAVADAILLTDSHCRVMLCNRAARELFGEPLQKIIGRFCWEVVHGTRQPVANCVLQRARENGRREETEIQRGQRCYRLSVDPSFDHDGQPTGTVHIIRDITERKRAEEALRQSEEKFRLWLDAIPMLACEANAKGEVETCNARWYEYTGSTPAQTAGFGWLNAVHPDDRATVASQIRRCLQTGQPYNGEYKLRRHDGVYRWHLARVVPVRNRRDNIIMWVGCAADIEELKRLEDALRHSEEQFRLLTNLVPQHIWITDASGRPEFANEQRIKYTGISVEEARAAKGWFAAIHPEDRRRLIERQRRTLARGTPDQWEYRLRSAANGQYRWFLGRAVPIRNAKGQLIQWFCTATDIDDQKRLEQTLEQRIKERTAELEREMERRRKLERQILDVTERIHRQIGRDLHDGVGQRLAAAKLLCSSLSRRLPKKSPITRNAKRASRELHKAIEEVRAIARGLHPVRAGADGLMAALHELAETTRKFCRATCRLDCPRPVLVADPNVALQLYRIAQEAVHNAARHAKPKCIEISLRQKAGVVHLRVLDDGRGLPPPSHRGNGLGLHTMKHRADLIGATFSIRRRETGGTVVSCRWRIRHQGAEHAR